MLVFSDIKLSGETRHNTGMARKCPTIPAPFMVLPDELDIKRH